jgi:hypothetical protein
MPAHTNRAAARERYRVIRIGGDKPGTDRTCARGAVIRVRIEEDSVAINTAANATLDGPYREPDR